MIWAWVPFLALVVLPTVTSGLYYGLIASDRYVSEASFLVRKNSQDEKGNGLLSFLQSTGLASSEEDAGAVKAYIESHDGLAELKKRVPLADIYHRPGADFVARWPSFIYPDNDEDLLRYYNSMTQVVLNHTTGVLELSVQSFRAEDSQAVGRALLELSEALVNRINDRVRDDALATATEQVKRGQAELVDAQTALTDFRQKVLMIDPDKSSTLLVQLLGNLATTLAQKEAEIARLKATTADSPAIASLQKEVDALRDEMNQQRSSFGEAGERLSEKLATYERLSLQREFATTALASAVAALDVARNDIRRQHIFLERISEPHLSDKSTEPRRFVNVITIFGWSFLLYWVLWLLLSGARAHRARPGGVPH